MYDDNSIVYRNHTMYVALSLTVYCDILIDIIAVFLILTRATSQLKAVLKFLEENAKKIWKMGAGLMHVLHHSLISVGLLAV